MQPTESTFDAAAPGSPIPASVLYRPVNWFEPLDWRAVFAQDRPLEIDLGCGRGAFLLWAAHTYPQRNFLGVERLLRRLRRVDRKAVRAGLDNLRLIRIEAAYLIVKLVPDNCVSTYPHLVPDPWPKRRHQSRRLDFARHCWGSAPHVGGWGCGQLRDRSRRILRVDPARVSEEWAIRRAGSARLAAGSMD